MANAAKLLKNNIGKLLASNQALTSQAAFVGIPQDKDARDDDAPINNATIGYIMDHGAPEQNIPAREWLRPAIAGAQPKIIKQLEWGAQQALAGNMEGPDQALNRAGLVGQNAVRAYINAGISPLLSDSTLVARQRRGRAGTKPLVDTGQFRNSVTYVIRGKR